MPELTTKAKIGFGLGAAVFLGGAAVFVITSIIAGQLNRGPEVTVDFTKKDAVARKQEAKQLSADALHTGNDSAAAEVYARALSAESDPQKKVELAIDHSKLQFYAGDFDAALKTALQAESFSSDKFLISDWLGRLYALGKRYNDAANYYTKAGTLRDSPTNIGQYSKEYYDKKAADMKAEAASRK